MRHLSKVTSSGLHPQAQQQPPVEPLETKLMRKLEAEVANLGGQLPAGWRCAVKTRVKPNGEPCTDAYYFSPEGARFRCCLTLNPALLSLKGGSPLCMKSNTVQVCTSQY
jgi:hypothetical protein